MAYTAHLPCTPFIERSDLPCCDGGYDLAEQDDAIELATEWIWGLTARQFGVCSTTIVPVLGCFWATKIPLNVWPVTSVDEVREDSVVLDPASYYVDHYRDLIRTDGKFSTVTELIEIDVTYGLTPPALIRRATAKAACEFLKFWNGKPCGLPDRVTSVSRPGVTMAVASSEDLLQDGGFTGIYEIDLAVKLYNPNNLQSAPMVWSPEINKRHRVRTS